MNETTEKLCDVFEAGKRYTIYRIGSMMAMTTKQEIRVDQIDHERARIIFTPRGKRKQYILPLAPIRYSNGPVDFFSGAVFDGWDQPIHCDTEACHDRGGVMRGNACYNFLGTPEQIRAWIDAGQLNPLFEKNSVLAIDQANGNNATEIVVFPEAVQPGRHAVIDQIMENVA